MTWHTDAACAGHPNPNLWHHGDPHREARAICMGCPVRADCLDEALSLPDSEAQGMWGGMTESERRAERRRRGMKVPRVEWGASRRTDGYR